MGCLKFREINGVLQSVREPHRSRTHNHITPILILNKMTDWKEAAKQIAVGAVFGGVGGGMDAVYTEPAGAVLAACLASMQCKVLLNCPMSIIRS